MSESRAASERHYLAKHYIHELSFSGTFRVHFQEAAHQRQKKLWEVESDT